VWILNTNAPLPKEGEGSSDTQTPSSGPKEGRTNIAAAWAHFIQVPEEEEAVLLSPMTKKEKAWWEVELEL
jgi:hypothetical protein